jgi:hypothetical protein
MITTRSAGLILTLNCGLVVAGGVAFWQRHCQAAEPPGTTAEQGQLQGRFTAAHTGEPVAGAKVRVLIDGVSDKANFAEALSGPDGRYVVAVPLGHSRIFGVHAPKGYYTQDPESFGTMLTTAAEPNVDRDFVLEPGSPWQVEVHGVTVPADKPPQFSAYPNPEPNPEQQWFASGEIIRVGCDARGKAVLTVPADVGRYRFSCDLMQAPSRYEIPSANLEIEANFNPRRIKGAAEPIPERKAARLRDAAGRSAVVEGVEVLVDAGQAVLRFHAQSVPNASALVLRGAAVDEAGKPVEGAKFTAAFRIGRSGRMSQLEATTDAQGRFELPDVLLPQSFFEPESRVQMIAVKSGFHAAQTKELHLLEVKKAGRGDFGPVVLQPGRTLRGKVIDENDLPVHGAVVTNRTNYFLYSHLRCRTDAKGQFVMPDLIFGKQKIAAGYGVRSGQEEFDFDATSGECVITVRPTPKSGRRGPPGRPATPPPALPKPPVPRPQPDELEGAWDLTLLAFGPNREVRVWMVLDGTTLYVDHNANGDLTEPDERLVPDNPKDGSNRIGNPGMYTAMDRFEFAVEAGFGGARKFKLDRWVRAEVYEPMNEFEKGLQAKWLKLRWENSTLWRQEGLGQGKTPLLFMPKPADAQVCHLDGPLMFVLKSPDDQVLERGEGGCDVAFHIAVVGRPPKGAERQFYNPLATTEAPQAAHLAVEIEYPGKGANDPPLRRTYFLKERC